MGNLYPYLLIGLPAAAPFRDPPAEYRVAGRGASAHVAAITGYPPSRVLTRPQFYLLWLQLFGNVVVGITIISNAVCILVELTQLSAAAIAPLFGVVSMFNAAGRFFWGAISDRIGCNRTLAAMFAVQAATLLRAVHQLVLPAAAVALAPCRPTTPSTSGHDMSDETMDCCCQRGVSQV